MDLKEKNMSEKILVSEFVKKAIELSSNQDELSAYIQSVVVSNYPPIMTKRVVLETMLNKAITTDPNGTQYIDQFLAKVNLKLAMVILYTNLQLESITEGSGVSAFDDYDALQEIDAFSAFTYFIGEKEAKELAQVQESLINTFYERHSSVEAVINRFVENLDIVLKMFESSGVNVLKNLIEDMAESDEAPDEESSHGFKVLTSDKNDKEVDE